MTTEITIDIETIPSIDPAVRQKFIDDSVNNFKAPSDMTKERAARELGLTDANDIKFTSKDAMISRWEQHFAPTMAEQVGLDNWRKTSFDGATGHVCVIGFAIGNEVPREYSAYGTIESERDMLAAFFADLDSIYAELHHRPVVVGHNIARFDLPFLRKRAMILGVKPSRCLPLNATAWSEHIFDTMYEWDSQKPIKLDDLCKAFGLEGKGDIDGSMVADYVHAGRLAEVAEYCKHDVAITREVYYRMTYQTKPQPVILEEFPF